MELDPIRLRLLKELQRRKTDLKHASLAIGRNAAYLQQFVYRGTPKTLSNDIREKLAAHLGLDEDVLRHKHQPLRKSRSDVGVRRDMGPRRPTRGFAEIAEVDVRASAGAGALHEGLEEAKQTWRLPEALVRHELRADPEQLRIITIDGDSMEPVLSSGDRILLDTSQRVPTPPGIFVIWDGMGLVAKRAEHVPNSDPPRIVIRSENPQYSTYERDAEEINIVGRVIWTARRL